MMDWLLPLVGGLGLGSLIKSFVDHRISRKVATSDRLYQEKREAYFGLLDALHLAAIDPSDKNSKAFALWQTRCSLFGDPSVSELIQKIIDTNDGPRSERNDAFSGLVKAMRADLSK